MQIVLLLMGLPWPVLVTLIVAFALLIMQLLFLIAFIPEVSERIVMIIHAFRYKE